MSRDLKCCSCAWPPMRSLTQVWVTVLGVIRYPFSQRHTYGGSQTVCLLRRHPSPHAGEHRPFHAAEITQGQASMLLPGLFQKEFGCYLQRLKDHTTLLSLLQGPIRRLKLRRKDLGFEHLLRKPCETQFKRVKSFIFRGLWARSTRFFFFGRIWETSYPSLRKCVDWEVREDLCPSLYLGRSVTSKYHGAINLFQCQGRGQPARALT